MHLQFKRLTKEQLLVIALIVLICAVILFVLPGPNILRQVPPSF